MSETVNSLQPIEWMAPKWQWALHLSKYIRRKQVSPTAAIGRNDHPPSSMVGVLGLEPATGRLVRILWPGIRLIASDSNQSLAMFEPVSATTRSKTGKSF